MNIINPVKFSKNNPSKGNLMKTIEKPVNILTTMNKKINFTFEQLENVGIFNLFGELTAEHQDELKLLLMRATHGIDRAVLNLKKVTRIDFTCLKSLKKAYCTSIRLKSPLILTEVPVIYLTEIYNCETSNTPGTSWSPDYISCNS